MSDLKGCTEPFCFNVGFAAYGGRCSHHEALERTGKLASSLRDQITALTAQRDTLLKACKLWEDRTCTSPKIGPIFTTFEGYMEFQAAVDAAIALCPPADNEKAGKP